MTRAMTLDDDLSYMIFHRPSSKNLYEEEYMDNILRKEADSSLCKYVSDSNIDRN